MTTKAQHEAIQDLSVRKHYVYWALDADGILLYVGCTIDPKRRLAEHKASKAGWIEHLDSFRHFGPYNFYTARDIERRDINLHQPVFSGETAAFHAAKEARAVLFDRLLEQYLAEGMSMSEAASRTIAEVDEALPQDLLYRQRKAA